MLINQKASVLVPTILLLIVVQVPSAAAQNPQLFAPARELRAKLQSDQNQALERIRSEKSTKSLRLIRINLGILQQLTIDMNLRDQVTSQAITQKIDKRSDTDFTWYGQLSDVPGQAILVVKDGSVAGTIQRDQELYKIQSIGGGLHALIQIDESAFPPDEPPDFIEEELRAPAIPLPEREDQDVVTPNALPVIDVLVAYTDSAERAQGGSGNILASIQLAVDETNQSYQNSRINARLRLVRTAKVDYNEAGQSFGTILSNLAGTNDGFMDNIHSLRNTVGADVVVLIINQPSSCGQAKAILATQATAFAIVHYDCATGNYSFGHEIGHLQGARHNPQVDPSTRPFPYGHGFQNGNAWRTIMAYNCPAGCPRLQYWSNPNVTFGGVLMGDAATNNNARVLNMTSATMAGFRNPRTPAVLSLTDVPCGSGLCPSWQQIDNNPNTIDLMTDGTDLYKLDNEGVIWRYTGTPCSGDSCTGWQQLDNNSTPSAIISHGSAPYQSYSDGATQQLGNNPIAKTIEVKGKGLYQLTVN